MKFLIGFWFRFAVSLLVAAPAAALAQSDGLRESLLAMRVLDARVANIGHRLAVSSLDLCAARQWLPGFAVHDLSQYGGDYRDAAIRAFGLGEGTAVLAVARTGPAERAGLRPDDILLRLDQAEVPRGGADGRRSFDAAEHVLDMLDEAFVDGEATVRVRRGAETLEIRIEAEQGCASRFQVVPSRQLNAHADGRYVQLPTAFAVYAGEDEGIAAILAHEFAHNVLGHRARLDEAGVARGFFGNFGRSARLRRETEVEADRLSVYLLDRAGYDPEAAVRFWQRFGRQLVVALGDPRYPSASQRIRLFETEIARIRRLRAAGILPMPDFVDLPRSTSAAE